ncbi:MAG: MFS transporter [Kouleothrix sp.]|nr:MFS transporter [Kouleothrix sp.]
MIATLRQRNFALLWFAGLISIAGDWMLRVALPIYVYQLTGSALATGTMFIVAMLPDLLISPVAGVFVDRWDRKRTMVVANVLMALALLPLLAVRSVNDLWLIYIVAFAESTIEQFFAPAENALLPSLVDETHLVAANSLNSLNNNLARLVGPAIGGLAAALIGLGGVAILDATTFLIAALLVALISGARRADRTAASAPARGGWRSVWHEWLEGLRVIGKARSLRVIFGLLAIMALGEGVFAVLFVVFVNKVLGGGALQIGWLMSAQAIGGLAGGVLVGWLGSRISPTRMIGIGSVLFGTIDLIIFNYWRFYPGFLPAVLLFVAVGVPGVISRTSINTVLQLVVPDRFRGRVFATVGLTSALLAMIGTTLAGTLSDVVGVVTVLNIQGFGYVAAGVAALALLRSSQVALERESRIFAADERSRAGSEESLWPAAETPPSY